MNNYELTPPFETTTPLFLPPSPFPLQFSPTPYKMSYTATPSPILQARMSRTENIFQQTQENLPSLPPSFSPNEQTQTNPFSTLTSRTTMGEASLKKSRVVKSPKWNPSESNALLDLISQKGLDNRVRYNFNNRIKWENIKPNGRSIKQCQRHFRFIKNHPEQFPRYRELGFDKIFGKNNQPQPTSLPLPYSNPTPSMVFQQMQPTAQMTSAFSEEDFPYIDDFFLSFPPSPNLNVHYAAPLSRSLNPNKNCPQNSLQTQALEQEASSYEEPTPSPQEDINKATNHMKSMQSQFRFDANIPSKWQPSESDALLNLISQNIVNDKVQWAQFISDRELRKKCRDHFTYIQNNPEKFPRYQELGLEQALNPFQKNRGAKKRTFQSDWPLNVPRTAKQTKTFKNWHVSTPQTFPKAAKIPIPIEKDQPAQKY